MIICSCTAMSDRDLQRAIREIYSRDPLAVITPGRVYHALGCKISCHGCRPLVAEHIAIEVARQEQRMNQQDQIQRRKK